MTGTGTLPKDEGERTASRRPEVVRRIVSAVLLAALALGATLLSPWSFLVLVMVGGGLVAWEWGRLTRGNGFDATALISAVSVCAVAVLTALGYPELAAFILAAAAVAIFATAPTRGAIRLGHCGSRLRRTARTRPDMAAQRCHLWRRWP